MVFFLPGPGGARDTADPEAGDACTG